MPRQLGIPYRLNFYNQIQFFNEFNKQNGKRRKLYYSIYKINNEGNFQNTEIDCIFFDLDNEKCLENLQKIYKYCEEHNYKSLFTFSTKGFWAYLKTCNGKNLKYPKNALGEAQHKIAEDIGLTIGQSKEADIDSSVVGDIARITRAINSKDISRNRFCIVLKKEEIFSTYEEICKIAEKPRFEYYIYGTELYDISQHDKESILDRIVSTNKIIPHKIIEDIPFNPNNLNTDISNFLPCVQSWLSIPERGVWKARYFTALYLAQIGRSVKETEEICKKYFSKAIRTDKYGDNWTHMNKDRVIFKAFDDRKVFPSCRYLQLAGLCPYTCDLYADVNSPIYFNPKENE